jgi:hypothetical protein
MRSACGSRGIEPGRQRGPLRGFDLDERRTNRRPAGVASLPRNGRLHGRDHRQRLEDGARFVQRLLLVVGTGFGPVLAKIDDGRGVHVAGRGDAARAATAQRRQEHRLRAGEHIEARGLEFAQHGRRVVPVARAVLDAGHRARVGLQQPLDQRQADADLRDRRDVIQVDAQALVGDRIDHPRKAAKEPFVGHALVEKRRQHQHAGAARGHGVPRELDGVVERAGAGARHQAVGRNAVFQQRIEQGPLLLHGQRAGLGVGAEHRQAHALVEQPAAMPHEARHRRRQVGVERRQHRRQHAAQPGRAHFATLHWPYFCTAFSSNPKPSPGVWCSTTRPFLWSSWRSIRRRKFSTWSSQKNST